MDRNNKQSRAVTKKKKVLDKINGHDALIILKALASEDRSIAKRIEQIALEYLRDIDVENVASQVYHALEGIEVEDLWEQSGSMRYGYVEPSDRAWEMFEEALEPFTNELNRYFELSLENEAKKYCMGILKGIDQFGKDRHLSSKIGPKMLQMSFSKGSWMTGRGPAKILSIYRNGRLHRTGSGKVTVWTKTNRSWHY